jgi:hypothetical protein
MSTIVPGEEEKESSRLPTMLQAVNEFAAASLLVLMSVCHLNKIFACN